MHVHIHMHMHSYSYILLSSCVRVLSFSVVDVMCVATRTRRHLASSAPVPSCQPSRQCSALLQPSRVRSPAARRGAARLTQFPLTRIRSNYFQAHHYSRSHYEHNLSTVSLTMTREFQYNRSMFCTFDSQFPESYLHS